MSLRRPGSLGWLQPGLHIKRWLLLMGVSVFALSLGAGYALRGLYQTGFVIQGNPGTLARLSTLAFLPNSVRALIFAALGLGALFLSLRQLSRAMLVPFLKGDEDLATVYYRHRTQKKGPAIVALGGGTGSRRCSAESRSTPVTSPRSSPSPTTAGPRADCGSSTESCRRETSASA